MNEVGFRNWLERQGYAPASVSTRLSDARRIERLFRDLDDAYDADKIASVLARLAYSKADQQSGKPGPPGLEIDGNVYESLASYRSAISAYVKFRDATKCALLRTLNERIEYLFDREHQIGHAYFINCGTVVEVHDVVRNKIIPLLAEYFYEDWGKVALVLGDSNGDGRFLIREVLVPPPGFDSNGYGQPRYRWSVRKRFADDVYAGFA